MWLSCKTNKFKGWRDRKLHKQRNWSIIFNSQQCAIIWSSYKKLLSQCQCLLIFLLAGDIAVLDLTVLFEPKQLRVVAAKIKEDTLVSPLQQHHSALIRWLEERYSRGAVSVTIVFVYNFNDLLHLLETVFQKKIL